jgi:putative hydrolase of the HAD superfamily
MSSFLTKPQLKAILYDFDDTLIDWSGCTRNWRDINQHHISLVFDYVKSNIYPLADSAKFNETFHKLTFQAWTEAKQTLRTPHIGQLLMDTCANLGVPRRLLKVNDLMNAYQWEPIEGVLPFPDTIDVLRYVDSIGIKQGLVTNAYAPMTMRWREIEAYGLDQYLIQDASISAADIGYLKPDPRIFEAALESLKLQPNEVVFVGDSREADIAGAQNFGMKAILRVNPYTTRTDMPSVFPYKIVPDAEITSLEDIYRHLDDWYTGWREGTSKDSFPLQSLEEGRL